MAARSPDLGREIVFHHLCPSEEQGNCGLAIHRPGCKGVIASLEFSPASLLPPRGWVSSLGYLCICRCGSSGAGVVGEGLGDAALTLHRIVASPQWCP